MDFERYIPLRALLALIIILAPLADAVAQGGPVQWNARSYVERVERDVRGNQRRTILPANRLQSGDRLIYIVHYRNDSPRPASGFALANPVSPHIAIDGDRRDMEVSVDGGRNWGRLGQLALPSGLGGTRIATAQDVTHARWIVPPLPPGGSGLISYRATVR